MRLKREIEQYGKLIANCRRQLADPKFLAARPSTSSIPSARSSASTKPSLKRAARLSRRCHDVRRSASEIFETVRRALIEDIGARDVTSEVCVPAETRAAGRFFARQPLVVAGVELLPLIYDEIDLWKHSGDPAEPGEPVATARARRASCSRASAWP